MLQSQKIKCSVLSRYPHPDSLSYALLSLMLRKNLLVNDRITASFPTNIPPKHCNKRYKQQKWTLRNCYRLTSFQKPTIPIRFKLLLVCPSMPTFVFAVLCVSSFNILSDYFKVFLNLVAVHTVRILINVVTQLLKSKDCPTSCNRWWESSF